MNTYFKTIFLDRTILILTTILVLTLVLAITSSMYARKIEEENKLLNIRFNEIRTLTVDAVRMKRIVESKEKKIGLRKTRGVVSTLEQVLKNLGLRAKTIKPLKKQKVNIFTEDNAELEIQDTDLNSIVNLLYKIDTGDDGTSGTAEPTWPLSSGGTVVDNGATWTEVTFIVPQTIILDDIYSTAMLDYILYRAYSKDAISEQDFTSSGEGAITFFFYSSHNPDLSCDGYGFSQLHRKIHSNAPYICGMGQHNRSTNRFIENSSGNTPM